MKLLDVTKPFSFVVPTEVLKNLAANIPVYMTMMSEDGRGMHVKLERIEQLPGIDTDEDTTT
jgi:hypothetical protein